MIEARHLTKRFGPATAVDDVSFHVGRGEVVGFLGPNGAGKSTTMRMVTGFLPPTGGEALVAGYDVAEETLAARAAIGYLPENNPLYEDLRVGEYLEFRAALKGVPRRRRGARVAAVVEMAEVGDVRGRLIGACSKGYRQRIGLADALLSDPPVLLLDEPTVGLDPGQVVHTRALIKSLAADHTVILSTHILPEVEAICSRALILHRGRLLYDGPVAELRRSLAGGGAVILTLAATAAEGRACLETAPGVAAVEELPPDGGGSRFRVVAAPGADVREALFWACAGARLPILEMAAQSVSLEEAFLSLTTQEELARDAEREVAP